MNKISTNLKTDGSGEIKSFYGKAIMTQDGGWTQKDVIPNDDLILGEQSKREQDRPSDAPCESDD